MIIALNQIANTSRKFIALYCTVIEIQLLHAARLS